MSALCVSRVGLDGVLLLVGWCLKVRFGIVSLFEVGCGFYNGFAMLLPGVCLWDLLLWGFVLMKCVWPYCFGWTHVMDVNGFVIARLFVWMFIWWI